MIVTIPPFIFTLNDPRVGLPEVQEPNGTIGYLTLDNILDQDTAEREACCLSTLLPRLISGCAK